MFLRSRTWRGQAKEQHNLRLAVRPGLPELWPAGGVINPSFVEYKIPCALDMVETEQIHVVTEQYAKGETYNSKEVGEGRLSGFLAAVANAVYDATGVRVKELPIIPHKIIEAWAKRSSIPKEKSKKSLDKRVEVCRIKDIPNLNTIKLII